MPAPRFRSLDAGQSSTAALSGLPDPRLLELACKGKPEAFEVLYDRHSGIAYSLASRICGASGLAEDVVQEAFLSVWRGCDRYDPRRGQVRSWLLGIVHNSAIDRMRRSSVHERRRASSEGIEERLEAPERTDEEVVDREQAKAVRSALATLPEEQRRVIELAYFDGLTHTQIATTLEQPVGTIKGRMRLGLLKLQSRLRGHAGQSTDELREVRQ
ncbi:MAG: sigma-70 family RNA polymerase sigma factor [Solirubrobacterales bacterium]|nr:sigma-70 family RNA polymerase sigma factor [Solirubrobacterales bacterium]